METLPEGFRAVDDLDAMRNNIFSGIESAVKTRYPVANETHELVLRDLEWDNKQKFGPKEQRRALLEGQTLGRKLYGTWELRDRVSGQSLGERRNLVMRAPYLTSRGTFIIRGNDYTMATQSRLKPGVFTRKKKTGELEAHVNLIPGSGRSFRMSMDPESGVFRASVGQANIPAYRLFQAAGASDDEMSQMFGRPIWEANKTKAGKADLEKLWKGLARAKEGEEPLAGLQQALERARLDPEVVQRTLGIPAEKLDKQVLLATAQKLIKLNRGEAEPDDRDSEANQMLFAQEDLISERVARDADGVARRLLWKLSRTRDISKIPSGLLTNQAYAAIMNSGLGQPNQEINPLEVYDQLTRVSRLGEGGISADAVPAESRNVRPSQTGFVDIVRGPECYDELTQVLTSDGWMPWPEVTEDHELAQPVISAGRFVALGFLKPLELISSVHAGPMYVFNGRTVNQSVTAGHRCWVAPGFSPAEFEFVEAQDLPREPLCVDHRPCVPETPQSNNWMVKSFLSGRAARVRYPRTPGLEAAAAQAGIVTIDDGAMTVLIRDVRFGLLNDPEEASRRFIEYYRGRVYCARTQTGLLYVRRSGGLPFWSGNSSRIGVDARFAQGTFLGGRNLHRRMRTPDGKEVMASAVQVNSGVLVLPDEWEQESDTLWGIKGGKLQPVKREEVTYILPSGADTMHPISAMSAGYSGEKGNRLLMGGKMTLQALPLADPEAPAVQSEIPGTDRSYEQEMGRFAGAVYADKPAVVKEVTADRIVLQRPAAQHSKSTTQLTLSRLDAAPFRAFAQSLPEQSLWPDEADGGRELSPHVTALYGIEDEDVEKVQAALRGVPPVRVTIGKLSAFARPESPFDVLKADVESEGLHGIHDLLKARLPNSYAWPDYRPHLTLAYMQKGATAPYEGDKRFAGRSLTFDRLQFKTKSGRAFDVHLNGKDELPRVEEVPDVEEIELYSRFPMNSKTFFDQRPVVAAGDVVRPGQLLARSNFTDEKGTAALGRNLRVAFMPFRGNYEDGITISQSAAARLRSDHMYKAHVDLKEEGLRVSGRDYRGLFPSKFSREQLDKVDDDGYVRPGSTVNFGDPLVLAVKTREPRPGMSLVQRNKQWEADAAVTWDHEEPGIVTDVVRTGDEATVVTQMYNPMKIGDKLSNRFGGKGLVSEILPDDEMPRDEQGRAYDVAFNSLGLISRVNPIMVAEAALGRISEKTGEPQRLPPFVDQRVGNYAQYALDKLKENNMPEFDRVYDPSTNRWHDKVFTGKKYFYKLHHMAEHKIDERDVGAYASDGTPAKVSGGGGAKRVGNLDVQALLAHGATEVIKDAKLVRGQNNPEYWKSLRFGEQPAIPDTTFVTEKFESMLRGAGVNLTKSGTRTSIGQMTDAHVQELTEGRELRNGDAIDMRTRKPIPGGLFDTQLTGGSDGRRWSQITLAEPLPHPMAEEPIKRLLGMTTPQFMDLLKNEGGEAIRERLSRINVKNEIARARQEIRTSGATVRDAAVKRLKVLTGLERQSIQPTDLVITRVPVLPPVFRPTSVVNGMELTSDANLLYKDLFEANTDYAGLREQLGSAPDERLGLYKNLAAVVGLGEPLNPKTQEKQAAGFLTHVFGKGSPKFGLVQRKLLATTVDSVGRAAVIPNQDLDIDQVGIPESMAWTTYKPYVLRRLHRSYNAGEQRVPLTEMVKWIEARDPRARAALDAEMKERPVIMSRAPVWHKFGIMAHHPVIVPGNTIQVSPMVTPGYGMDFDGDTVNLHVPSTPGAVKQALEKMLPSRNLFSSNRFDVHMVPRQEFLIGLYQATRGPSKKPAQKFDTRAEALAAFRAGKLDMNDPINIAEPS
jgi:DNA-directed RNA polymerase beta subunit